MKILKENLKSIIAFVIGVILTGGIAVYATTYRASDIQYTNNKNVANALDDLYTKVPNGTIPITTKGNQINVSAYQYADTSGMYTASEYNAKTGKGTHWNSDYTTTTAKGTYDIDVGFTPSKIYIRQVASATGIYDAISYYDSDKNTSHTYTVNHNPSNSTGAYSEYSLNDTTTVTTHIISIGSTVSFRANQVATYYWFAVE